MDSFPATLDVLAEVEVEYVTFEGWKVSISKCRTFDSLPQNAKKYLNFIEQYLQVPIEYIGVGKEREAVIENSKFMNLI